MEPPNAVNRKERKKQAIKIAAQQANIHPTLDSMLQKAADKIVKKVKRRAIRELTRTQKNISRQKKAETKRVKKQTKTMKAQSRLPPPSHLQKRATKTVLVPKVKKGVTYKKRARNKSKKREADIEQPPTKRRRATAPTPKPNKYGRRKVYTDTGMVEGGYRLA